MGNEEARTYRLQRSKGTFPGGPGRREAAGAGGHQNDSGDNGWQSIKKGNLQMPKKIKKKLAFN